jgi:hypothetical protein
MGTTPDHHRVHTGYTLGHPAEHWEGNRTPAGGVLGCKSHSHKGLRQSSAGVHPVRHRCWTATIWGLARTEAPANMAR